MITLPKPHFLRLGLAVLHIFFLPSYPLAACTGDPAKLATMAFFAGTMQPTLCQITATNLVAQALRFRVNHCAGDEVSAVKNVFAAVQPINELLRSPSNSNAAC
jgi:hypothetical protein